MSGVVKGAVLHLTDDDVLGQELREYFDVGLDQRRDGLRHCFDSSMPCLQDWSEVLADGDGESGFTLTQHDRAGLSDGIVVCLGCSGELVGVLDQAGEMAGETLDEGSLLLGVQTLDLREEGGERRRNRANDIGRSEVITIAARLDILVEDVVLGLVGSTADLIVVEGHGVGLEAEEIRFIKLAR